MRAGAKRIVIVSAMRAARTGATVAGKDMYDIGNAVVAGEPRAQAEIRPAIRERAGWQREQARLAAEMAGRSQAKQGFRCGGAPPAAPFQTNTPGPNHAAAGQRGEQK